MSLSTVLSLLAIVSLRRAVAPTEVICLVLVLVKWVLEILRRDVYKDNCGEISCEVRSFTFDITNFSAQMDVTVIIIRIRNTRNARCNNDANVL